MKRILVLVTLIACGLTLVGCRDHKDPVSGTEYDETVIEGCQYIKVTGYAVSHKGNCTNIIHPENWSKK